MSDAAASPLVPPAGTRKRLDHIDAMRPIKQAAVVSTHALIFFAPLGSSLLALGAIMLTRFSRDAFLFVSACMLAYSYRDSHRMDLLTYSKRRLISVGLPYLTWTIIYALFTMADKRSSFPFYVLTPSIVFSSAWLHHFWHLLLTGYYHLYYLVVILEFYVAFPLLLWVLRRLSKWHVHIMIATVLWQGLYGWALATRPFGFHLGAHLQTRLIISYPIYLIGGVIVAFHLNDVHDWVVKHTRTVLFGTLAAAIMAEGLMVASHHVYIPEFLRTGGDVFAAMEVPYNVGAILSVYLLGVYLVSPNRTPWTRAATQSGADLSYAVYLSQMLWIPMLGRVFGALNLGLPWEVRAPIALVIVYSMGLLFGTVFSRLPWTKATTGRSRVTWASLKPHKVKASSLHEDHGDGPLEVAPD